LRDYSDVYHILIGVFRVLYSIEQARLLIIVLKIGQRRDVYR
jgi:mRNA-degrading endonuclease RelE of RelBE toxin-antitoxin system